MRIDAHHHFWDLSRGDYEWLTPDLAALYHNYGPHDLAPHLSAVDVSATVLVQAAPTSAETQYLLSIAERIDWVRAVVGWVNFEAEDAARQVHELSGVHWLKGLRPMIQDIKDVTWMLRPKFDPVFQAMITCNLRLDALVQPRHLDVLTLFVKKHSSLKIVINHGAKPKIACAEFDVWAEKLATLAEYDNVFCKLSGLWTEADGNVSSKAIAPYAKHLLTCFGAQRLMWGSDWPVLRLAGEYEDWFAHCQSFIDHLTESEKSAIMGNTARQFYAF